MRVPTVQIRRPDGKVVTINECDLKHYIGLGFDLDQPRKQTSGGETTETADETAEELAAEETAGTEEVID